MWDCAIVLIRCDAFDIEVHFVQQEFNSHDGWHALLDYIKKKIKAPFNARGP